MRPLGMATLIMLLLAPGRGATQTLFAADNAARRNRDFDVLHYCLTLSFNEEAGRVRGQSSLRLTPLLTSLDSVVLDAVDMTVEGVRRADGQMLKFRNASPHLTVYLDRTVQFGETLTVAVTYECVPRRGLYFIRGDSTGGRRRSQIWTQGEDMDNRCWFPCYDYPNDKATSEVIATVREEYTLLSNGRLAEERHDAKTRTRTFHWIESRPHASYLIMIAAGEYVVSRARVGGIPLMYYVYPEDSTRVDGVFGATPAMLRFFEEWTGVPYPWEKFAQIFIDEFMWGGMENTSAVTLNTATMVDARAKLDFPSEPVVAHELAHQWWGDLVTCRDWTHLWLHEGFATYFESLFTEASKGPDEFQYEMIQASFEVRMNERRAGEKPIVSHDSHPVNLYQRGAWVLHMLRSILGEEAFQRGMRTFLRRYAYANAETDEFKLAIEDVTGQNLGWFFDQWVYGTGLPELEVGKEWNESTGTLSLTVQQKQSADSTTGVFRFPLRVQILTPTEDRRTSLDVTRQTETFLFPLREKPVMVIVDKGYVLLKEMTFRKPVEEYLYQLAHAEDVADRISAAQGLERHGDAPGVRDALAAAARGDRFRGVRKAAIGVLGGLGGTMQPGPFLAALADPSSLVRNEAAKQVARLQLPDVGALLDSVARHDPSYVVAGTCVTALAKVDSTRGFLLARDMLGNSSYRGILQEAALAGLKTLGERAGLSLVIPFTGRRETENIRVLATSTVGVLGKGLPEGRQCIGELLHDALPGVRAASVAVAEKWNDPALNMVLKQRMDVEQDPDVRAALTRALAHGDRDSHVEE